MKNNIVLTRILLKNWTGFNGIYNFSETSTLLHGSNGAGKSTFVDAMNLVLSGSKKFNEASDKGARGNADRNIASAIHNKNFKTQEVLRKHKVIAYVILEFYDCYGKYYFLNGLQMKSEKYVEGNNHVIEKYFTVLDKSLDDFKKTIFDPDYEETDILGRSRDAAITVHESKDEAFRDFFKVRQMTVTDWREYEKQNSRVLKAKLTNQSGAKISPNEFVKANVLIESKDTASSSIENLRSQKESYANMKKLFEEQDAKKGRLEDMLKQMSKLHNAENELELVNGSKVYLKLNESREQLDREIKSKTNLERNLLEIATETSALEERKIEVSKRKEEIVEEISRNSSDAADALAKLNRELVDLNSENSRYHRVMRTVSDISNKYDWKYDSLPDKEAVEACCNAVSNRIDFANVSASELRMSLNELKKEDESLQSEIGGLSKGIVRPENLGSVQLRDEMNRILEKNGKSERAYLLYELIESIDPKWQLAIESFLGNRRYALIIDKKYEVSALKVYKNFKGSLIARYREFYREVKNNAAEMVKIKNNDVNATNYINSLLKGVELCETEEDLAKANVGLMTDGRASNSYVYENREVKHIRLICGQEAIKKEKINKEEELRVVRNEYLKKQDKLHLLNSEIRSLKEAYNFLTENRKSLNYSIKTDLDAALETKEKLLKEIESDKENAALKLLHKERESIQVKERVIDNQMRELARKEGHTKSNLENCQKMIESLTETVRDVSDTFAEHYSEKESEIEAYVNELKDKSDEKLDELFKNLTRRVSALKSEIDRRQTDYRNSDKLFIGGCDKEAYDRIKEQYDKIKDIDLTDTQKKIDEISAKLDHSKDNFFKAIYKDYVDASEMITELNRKLSKVPFCGDIIRIKIKVNDGMRGYFEAIQRCYADEVDPSRVGEPYESTAADHENLERLFKKMLDASGSEMATYENYKNYIDTEVTLTRTMEDGTTSVRSLEKDNKSNSGGQEQTPYYIILAISLLSTFKDSGVRIMLLDEAFSKMDNARTAQVLNFFEEINMQVIMSTMRTDMFSLVDMTHVFKRHEETTRVQVLTTQYDKMAGKSKAIASV